MKPTADRPAEPPPPVRGKLVLGLPSMLAAAALAAMVLLSIVHLGDRYQVGHVGGIRMGLAFRAAEGTLFPPLYDGASYGGSYYMPLPVVLHAAVSRITGEFLTSGKIVSLLSTLALLALLWIVMRRAGQGRMIALVAVGAVASTQVVFEQAAGIAGDALPAALQLGAVGLVARRTEGRTAQGAGVLAAIAPFAKLTAVWGALAVAAFLLVRDRAAFRRFALAFAVTFVAVGGLTTLASGGRIWSTMLALSGGTLGGGGLLRPARVPLLLLGAAPVAWLLAPLALVEVVAAIRSRAVQAYHWMLPAVGLVTAIVFLMEGTNTNHLVDAIAVIVVLVGLLVLRAPAQAVSLAPVALSLLVVWGLLTSAATAVLPRDGGGRVERSSAPRPLDRFIDPADEILSEDPGITVAYGRRPVMADPFQFLRLAEARPDLVDPLIRMVEGKRFDFVVLQTSLDDPRPEDWYERFHLGPSLTQAIAVAYRPLRPDGSSVEGYYVYVPA